MKVLSGKGFTIIELIVVIAIIAILAAIVLVNIFDYIQKAQNAAIIETISGISRVSTMYFAENGTYIGFTDGDANYVILRDAYLAIYPDHNPTERETSNAFCVCYDLKGATGDNKHTLCIDSTGYTKEMNYNKDCGWRCRTSGTCRD